MEKTSTAMTNSESTIKTLLRRLVNKSYLATAKEGQHFIYTPLIREDQSMKQITTEVFSHICEIWKRERF